ncbi:MAG: ComEA family DNA-binding protein [Phycisphaerae bacterium]
MNFIFDPLEPAPSSTPVSRQTFTRRWLFVALLLPCFAAIQLRVVVDRQMATFHQCQIRMQTLVNPNCADWPALATLPGIGKTRAQRIVSFREQAWQEAGHALPLDTHGAEHGSPSVDCGVRVYASADDLCAVHGIGPKTARSLAPFLIFESKD